VTQFYKALPSISTASDKCWGEKPGYKVNTLILVRFILGIKYQLLFTKKPVHVYHI